MELHVIARKILETYLNEGKVLAGAELGPKASEYEAKKDIVFVTLYKDGKVIASSGRVHLRKPNTLAELVDNTLLCLKDSRIGESLKNPLELTNVRIRVDTISSDKRRVIASTSEMDPKREGLILLSQTLGKLSVLLPNITNIASSPDDLFAILCKKAGLDPASLKSEDFILYAIESTQYSEF